MAGIAGRVRANLSLSWRWFNYWRKRYMWLRLLILLLVFAQPIYEIRKPLIRELVVIAIKGIESAKRGPYFETRAIQHEQKKRLQRALLARFDGNQDGRLSASEARSLTEQTGLSRQQVEGRALEVELDPLVEANHTVGLLSRTQTANDFRREGLATALADHQREHGALWDEIAPDLEIQYPTLRDYLRWSKWKEGLDWFEGYLVYPLVGLLPALFCIPHLTWVLLGLAGILALGAMRRFGKGKELERRFLEEPSLAAAPCPVCGEATEDIGALAQHRSTRAWAMGAVGFLGTISLLASRGAFDSSFETFGMGNTWMAAGTWYALAAGAVLGIAKFVLWPREVHLIHRRPWARTLGFILSVVLVVGLLFSVGLASVRTWAPPARVVMVGSGKEGDYPRRRREARQAPATPRDSSIPAAMPSATRTPRAWRDGRVSETRPEREQRIHRRRETRGEDRGRRGRALSPRATRD